MHLTFITELFSILSRIILSVILKLCVILLPLRDIYMLTTTTTTTTTPIVMTKQNPQNSHLLSLKDIPGNMTWLTENPFLLHRYRKPTTSFLTCITSNFSCLHTESLNIITHLISTLLALYALVHLLLYKQPLSFFSQDILWENTPTMDRFVLCLMLAGVTLSFGLSTLYHTFSCHRVYGGHFLTADLMGIVTHCYSLTQGIAYFMLYSYPTLLITSTLSNILFTSICLFLVNIEPFSVPDKKVLRSVLLSVYVTVIYGPLLFSLTFNLFIQVDVFTYFMFCLATCSLATGAFLYSIKFPESCAPGSCDIWGQSHTTMHMTSTLAALLYYQSILLTAEFAYKQ